MVKFTVKQDEKLIEVFLKKTSNDLILFYNHISVAWFDEYDGSINFFVLDTEEREYLESRGVKIVDNKVMVVL